MASKKILNSYRSIEILFFIFFILIAYVLPLTNLLQIDFLKKYVAWYMGHSFMLNVIATRSHDYDGYSIFFSLSALLIIPATYFFIKLPIYFYQVRISRNKLRYILGYTFFMPAFIFLIVFTLSSNIVEVDRHNFIGLIIALAAYSKPLLIVLFGSLYLGLALFLAITITWFFCFRQILKGI